MKTLYLDCFAGISGDMLLGALIDLGVSPEELNDRLRTLNLTGYEVSTKKVSKNGICGTKFTVSLMEPDHRHRHLPHITDLINNSTLPQQVKALSCSVFNNLAAAEAKIHGIPQDMVHFHEVGAVDSIIDIVGAVTAIDMLGVEQIFCSPLPLGHGFVNCAHGIIPLPAPAALELLTDIPVKECDIEGETVTPTGAALAATLSLGFGPLPPMNILKIGYGAGEADRKIPNLLRTVLGETGHELQPSGLDHDMVNIIEANIDDMNPEFFEHVVSRLFTLGAIDVWITPVLMKKGRPGQIVTCLAAAAATDTLVNSLLSETTTLGVRVNNCTRYKLSREIVQVDTAFGSVPVKIGLHPTSGKLMNVAPEWEDCRKKAIEHEVPAKLVYDAAKASFYSK